MVSGISFGQVTNVAQQGQTVAPQAVYYATPQMQADTYVSSTTKKKSHPLAKLITTAAVVLGGSALATKIPAVKKAVEKIAKNPESANIVDKALNGVNKLGQKVLNVVGKGKEKIQKIIKKGETCAKNVDNVDVSGLSDAGKARVNARRAADELKNIKTHNPKDVIIMGDGKPVAQLALPAPKS